MMAFCVFVTLRLYGLFIMFDPLQVSIIFRLIFASVLGAILGFEREYVGKSAGLRTYTLVSFGAALFTMLSDEGLRGYLGITSFDPSRIISQIIVGVGFIGGGLIIFQEKENRVHGLTTAAGLWAVAAIGCAAGLKYYLISVFSTIFILLLLSGTRYLNLEQKIHKMSGNIEKGDDKAA